MSNRFGLQVTQTSGSKYNVAIMNAVVLYVEMLAIEVIQDKQQRVTISTIAHTIYMDIFQNLAVLLCTQGTFPFYCFHYERGVFRTLSAVQRNRQSAALPKECH